MTENEVLKLLSLINESKHEKYAIDDIGSVGFYDNNYYVYLPVETTYRVSSDGKSIAFIDTFDILMDDSQYGKPIIALEEIVYQ